MKRVLLSIVRGDRVGSGLFAIALILAAAVVLALAPPALAQFTSDAPPAVSDSGDAASPPAADPPADVPIDSLEPMAADGGAASDDSAAKHPDWVRSGDEGSGNGAAPDQVLEVPQAADPATAQPSDGAGQTARDGDSSSSDQVGSIGDYQDEQYGEIGIGGLITPGALNPYGPGTFRANSGTPNPALGRGYVPINPSGANMARPSANGMNTAIGSTSPMLPGPRNLSPSPGGWWSRGR
jgi:hypothetical protein